MTTKNDLWKKYRKLDSTICRLCNSVNNINSVAKLWFVNRMISGVVKAELMSKQRLTVEDVEMHYQFIMRYISETGLDKLIALDFQAQKEANK